MKKLTPLAGVFALLFPVVSFAQVGHVTEIVTKSHPEGSLRKTQLFTWKDNRLVKRELKENYRLVYTYAYAAGIRYEQVSSTYDAQGDSLVPSSRKSCWYTKDSLLAGMNEMNFDKKSKKYYSYHQTLYTFLDNHMFKGYEVKQVKQSKWESFYRSIHDSTYTSGHRQLFQSYKTGQYETTAHIYFDSIRIVKNKLQFLVRSDETNNPDERMYDKYVFTTKGAFVSYENWSYYSDVKKMTWNCSYIYESDANGRPAVCKQWAQEGETMEGDSDKPEVFEVDRFTYESSGTAAMATKRTGSYIFVDWCMDTGRPAELILLDKELKVKHYNYFPLGQPYFKAAAVPHGTYYLIVFSREASCGGMMSVEL